MNFNSNAGDFESYTANWNFTAQPTSTPIESIEYALKVTVEPPKLAQFYKITECNLAQKVQKKDSLNTGMAPGLGRPTFSPLGNGQFVCGTEERGTLKLQNRIIFGKVDIDALGQNKQKNDMVKIVKTHPLSDCVRGVEFLNLTTVCIAVGGDIGIIENQTTYTWYGGVHEKYIREIAFSESQHSLLSGATDGRLIVFNPEYFNSTKRLLMIFGSPVGSVRWSPTGNSICSATTDGGTISFFDTRTENPCNTINLFKDTLYTHTYWDENTILLGFGDGSLQLFDCRIYKPYSNLIRDPSVDKIGDIVFNNFRDRKQFASFGSPAFSLWCCDTSREIPFFQYYGSSSNQKLQTSSKARYKIQGNFIPNNGDHSLLATTDSLGYFSVFNIFDLKSNEVIDYDDEPITM